MLGGGGPPTRASAKARPEETKAVVGGAAEAVEVFGGDVDGDLVAVGASDAGDGVAGIPEGLFDAGETETGPPRT